VTAATVLDRLAAWAVGLVELLGGPGAGLAIALENLFPTVPSELVLPMAGFAASRGSLTLVEAIVWTTAGSVVGALVLYAAGRRLGPHRTRALLGRLPLVVESDLAQSEAWFARRGRRAVLIGRLIPVVRSFVSVPAGVQDMHLVTFVSLTAAGSLIWNTTLVLSGYLLGDRWYLVEAYGSVLSRGVLVAAAVTGVVFLVRRLRRRRARGG
jgi:membrane protein DedA with SNARE-associated domain